MSLRPSKTVAFMTIVALIAMIFSPLMPTRQASAAPEAVGQPPPTRSPRPTPTPAPTRRPGRSTSRVSRSPGSSGPAARSKPFPEGVQPPAQVLLTNYDATSGHNVADVFARWYDTTFFASPDGDPAHTLAAQLQNNTAQLDPGHPLTDPCWVEVTIDGVARSVLVQVFEPGP